MKCSPPSHVAAVALYGNPAIIRLPSPDCCGVGPLVWATLLNAWQPALCRFPNAQGTNRNSEAYITGHRPCYPNKRLCHAPQTR